jgi:hypothetical protein
VDPELLDSRSTLRVLTPLTQASSTIATIACSERRRGSRKLGKHAGPERFSISPTRVSHALG